MKLYVHGTADAVVNGQATDSQNNGAVVRVVVQEWRRKYSGGYERSGEPLFIDLHTSIRRVAERMICIVKSDTVLVEGYIKSGFDRTNRPFAFIEVCEIAVIPNKQERIRPATEQYDGNLPPVPDGFNGFAQADVTALPEKETGM